MNILKSADCRMLLTVVTLQAVEVPEVKPLA
jgi:hypothetical protein